MDRAYRTPRPQGASAGWVKGKENPVLGGAYGTCFDMAMLDEDGVYKMWFSWRPVRLIGYVQSVDGVHWSQPIAVLKAELDWEWQNYEVNRPVVLKRDGLYHMWYTGQSDCGVINDEWVGKSAIGYATSVDGLTWEKRREPVLVPEEKWEYVALMCPHVLYENDMYRMWYSGGEQAEPDAIGYAESKDGIHWTKNPSNPIFTPRKDHYWEYQKVTASYVMKLNGWYQMFYIGFDEHFISAIGVARSKDGVTNWERHPDNPIIAGTDDEWDFNGTCKPFVLEKEGSLTMWYNGGSGALEEIGVAYHPGLDLGY